MTLVNLKKYTAKHRRKHVEIHAYKLVIDGKGDVILFVSNYCGNWFRIQATTLMYLRTSSSQLLFFYVTILLLINLRSNRIIGIST